MIIYFLILFIICIQCERFDLNKNTFCILKSNKLKDDYISINSTNSFEIYTIDSTKLLDFNIYIKLNSEAYLNFNIDNVKFSCTKRSDIKKKDLNFVNNDIYYGKSCIFHYLEHQLAIILINREYNIFDMFKYKNVKLHRYKK